MPKIENEELVRVHIILYKRDVSRVDELWGKTLGRSSAVRQMVRKMLDTIEAKAGARAKALPVVDELGDLGGAGAAD